MLQASALLCNIFKVLLMEQNLGVIAGRLCDPVDRLIRFTEIHEARLQQLLSKPRFIASVRMYYGIVFTLPIFDNSKS